MKREEDWFDIFSHPGYINQCEKISRRVWSWLRMNAGGMLNTCKSYEGKTVLAQFYTEWRTGE
jgi:hypothetical protein